MDSPIYRACLPRRHSRDGKTSPDGLLNTPPGRYQSRGKEAPAMWSQAMPSHMRLKSPPLQGLGADPDLVDHLRNLRLPLQHRLSGRRWKLTTFGWFGVGSEGRGKAPSGTWSTLPSRPRRWPQHTCRAERAEADARGRRARPARRCFYRPCSPGALVGPSGCRTQWVRSPAAEMSWCKIKHMPDPAGHYSRSGLKISSKF